MSDMPVMVSTVAMSMSVAAITHVAITLLARILRAAMTAPVMMDSLELVINVLTSTNVIMVPIHLLKMLHVRTMLVHTCANFRMVITMTDLNA